jgi:ketosteroid isomerase-like protein
LPTRTLILALAIACAVAPAAAQEKVQGAATPESAEKLHDELRALRDALIKATNEGNIDGLLAHLHPNVVVTWQNAEVSRGHAGVRDYLQRMTGGPNPVVRAFKTAPKVDELTILYGGDTLGIAFGSSHDEFDLTDGTGFHLDARWTATLVREGGRWLVASFHASTNLFNNPVLATATRTALRLGIGGALFGVVLGLALGFVFLRRRRA